MRLILVAVCLVGLVLSQGMEMVLVTEGCDLFFK